MNDKILHDCEQFRQDMDEAGYDHEHYNGRNFWSGPAVRIDDQRELQSVIRATQVRLQWDNMGRGLIVYPVRSETRTKASQS